MEQVSEVGGAFIAAEDPVALSRWYVDQLGATTVAGTDGLMLFARTSAASQPVATADESWSVSFHVADLNAIVEQLRTAGATIELEPSDQLGGRVARVRDPEQNLIQLVEPGKSDRVWSADPEAVRVLGDGEEPAPEVRRRDWRRWAPWLSLLLAAVFALVFIATGDPDTSAHPPAPAPTTAARPTTSVSATTVTEGAVSVTEVEGPLLGVTAGWEVIAHGPGTVSRIELAEGRITTTEIPTLRSTGPVTLLSGPDWVVVRPLDSVPGYFVPDGEPARELHGWLGGGGYVFPGPKPNQVWVEDHSEETDESTSMLWLLSVAGERVGSMAVPATGWQVTSDHNGYVLAPMTGGTYVVRPEGVRRITTGKVDGVSPGHFLVTECDQQALCSRILIDRATGHRRIIHDDLVSPVLDERREAIAPDGSIAVEVREHDLWVTDLSDGSARPHDVLIRPGAEFPDPGVVFSPDSEWLFGVDHRGEIVAIDTDTFQTHELGVELPKASSLTIRAAG